MERSILVISGNPSLTEMIRRAIGDSDNDIQSAAIIETARGMMEKSLPGIVILDLPLPDRGLSNASLLPGFSGTAAVMVLAENMEDIEVAAGAGLCIDDFIIKPFEARELRARVEAILRRRGHRREIDHLSLTREMLEVVNSSVNLEHSLGNIISMIRKHLACESCVIFLEDDGRLIPARFISPHEDEIDAGGVLLQGGPLLVQGLSTDEHKGIFHDEKCFMCAPLINLDCVIGVIYIGTIREKAYNSEDLALSATIAQGAVIAIEKSWMCESRQHSLTCRNPADIDIVEGEHMFAPFSCLDRERSQEIVSRDNLYALTGSLIQGFFNDQLQKACEV